MQFHCSYIYEIVKFQFCGNYLSFFSDYVRGAEVRLRIKELELSSKFLGFEKDLTLLEADCALLGLVQPRTKNTQ